MTTPSQSSVREPERWYRVTVTFPAGEMPTATVSAIVEAVEKCGHPDAAVTGAWAPTCPAVLVVQGVHHRCELIAPHAGSAHSSSDAETIWTDDPNPGPRPTFHALPTDGVLPCCGRTDLALNDRIALNPAHVTCEGAAS